MAGLWWMLLVAAVFSIVVLGALALVIRSVTSTPRRRDHDARSAHRILSERYARGAISTEEFEEGRRVLDEQGR